MDEVVVVGYGTQRRANLSGAVATISGKDLNARSGSSRQPMRCKAPTLP